MSSDAERIMLTPEATPVSRRGPGYSLFYWFANFTNEALLPMDQDSDGHSRTVIARQAIVRTTSILGHLAIVLAMVMVGYWHFDNLQTGIAAASLYLLSPYTGQMTNYVYHVVPTAILAWSIVFYRKPILSGILIGIAGGMFFYPLFLLPLWISYYWQRGLIRFLIGLGSAILSLVVLLFIYAYISGDLSIFLEGIHQMFGMRGVAREYLSGFWVFHSPVFRIPVIVASAVMACSFAIWPVQKNLGTLISLAPDCNIFFLTF